MTGEVTVTRVDTHAEGWPGELERLRALVGAPHNPTLFPAHFLKATLPKIGGEVIAFRRGDGLVGVGFAFPRALREGQRVYTLRYHPAGEGLAFADARRSDGAVGRLLGGDEVVWYDPAAPQRYAETARGGGAGLVIAAPGEAEAAAIPRLQAAMWGATPDFLYPADLHSEGFSPGTTLAAQFDGRLAGFLFGFAKFGGSPLPEAWAARFGGEFRLESQLMGVLPELRQHRIGLSLKRVQGEDARRRGIGVVNWTVDPLQFGNAVLNFGALRAVAFDFYPDHYGFRNDLNQVAASRFGISWLVGTERVGRALAVGARTTIAELREVPGVVCANDGAGGGRLDLGAATIAIEVPGDWTALQRDALGVATRWRETTDALFAHYLGPQLGQYAVVGVARDGERRFLLAERVTEGLLAAYGA
jgi:predicted GNAT superfamily acetyltransferase